MLSRLGRVYPIKLNQTKSEHPGVSLRLTAPVALPSQATLAPSLGPIRDQGALGSCSSHAWTGLREVLYNKYYAAEKDRTVSVGKFNLSPLYHYYKERLEEGTLPGDNGAQLETGATVLEQFGCCLEAQDGYNATNFNTPPSDVQNKEAAIYQVQGTLLEISNLADLKLAISSGFPIVLGMAVYESFESDYTAKTGDMLVPNTKTEQCLGGHAIMAFGYDDKKEKITIRNSWGPDWGSNGNFFMGYKIFETKDLIIGAYTFHPLYLTPKANLEPEPEPEHNTSPEDEPHITE